MSGVNQDAVEDALRAAASDAAPAVASADTGEDGKVLSSDAKGAKVPADGSYVPRGRLNEALSRVRELEAAVSGAAKIQEDLKSATVANQTLHSQLAQHQDLMERIRSLAGNDKYRDHVVAIDKALKGIEDDVGEAMDKKVDAADKAGDVKLREELKKQKEEIFNVVSQDRAETLFQIASDRIERYMQALPEEYTSDHQRVIKELLPKYVQWGRIEEDPSVLNAEIASGLQKVIDLYPSPSAPVHVSEDDALATLEPQQLTPEQELARIFDKRLNWGATDEKGKPRVGDADFDKVLVHAIKARRAQESRSR